MPAFRPIPSYPFSILGTEPVLAHLNQMLKRFHTACEEGCVHEANGHLVDAHIAFHDYILAHLNAVHEYATKADLQPVAAPVANLEQ